MFCNFTCTAPQRWSYAQRKYDRGYHPTSVLSACSQFFFLLFLFLFLALSEMQFLGNKLAPEKPVHSEMCK